MHFTWNTTVFRSVSTPIMGHGTEHGGVPSQVQSAVVPIELVFWTSYLSQATFPFLESAK